MALTVSQNAEDKLSAWVDTRPSSAVSGTAELYDRLMSEDENKNCMSLQIGDYIPDFVAQSTRGEIDLHVAVDGAWSLVYICPRSFDAVASSDLATLAKMSEELSTELKVRRFAVSCDALPSIERWKKDIQELLDCVIDFPIIADLDAHIVKKFGLVRHDEDACAVRALVPASLLVLADPQRRIQLLIQYTNCVGHNFEELIRSIEAIQLSYQHPLLATRANWMSGDDVFISSDISFTQAKTQFPKGMVQIRPWFRLTSAPTEIDQHGDDDSATIGTGVSHHSHSLSGGRTQDDQALTIKDNLLLPSSLE